MNGQRIEKQDATLAEVWRLFVALELPEKIRARLIEHIARLRRMVPDARASWSRADNLHLTLKFLGDIPVKNVERLSVAASSAANKVEPFEFVIEGCGTFPAKGQPRILWVGIGDESGQLSVLHQALEEECAKAGFPREQLPFHPHLTIGRVRQAQGSRELAARHSEVGFESETARASELVLIRSELRSGGSRHTAISRHSLLTT
jgi:2'-5' RNA ligase